MKNASLATLLIASVALGSAGCDKKDSTATKPPPKPDNTANNKGDQRPENKTPVDQKENKADIDTTAAIRQAVVGDKTLSTNAHNVKIITEHGVVTLRGVVNSQAEKDSIEAKAKATAGVTRVDNQIEVKAP